MAVSKLGQSTKEECAGRMNSMVGLDILDLEQVLPKQDNGCQEVDESSITQEGGD